MRFRIFLIPALIVFVVSLIVLSPSFGLALFGDDWLCFWRYNSVLGPNSTGEWNYLTYFLTPYGPEDMSVGLLQKIFGYEATYYFVISYVLRLFATLSLAPLVYYLTKNRLAVFVAMLFFSITAIGFDATNWVFNMPSYLSIGLFNFFLYFLLKSREQNSWKLLCLSGALFYLTYVSQPIRMPHLLPFTISLELFWIFYFKSTKALKLSLISIFFFSLIFFIITKTGQSAGIHMAPGNAWSENFKWGIDAFKQNLHLGRIDLFFYPIIILGGLILPNISTIADINVATKAHLLFSLLIPIFAIFTLISFILIRNIEKQKKLLKFTLISAVVFNFFVFVLKGFNFVTLNSSLIILLLVGGYLIILTLALFIRYFHNQKVALALFLTLSWTITSFILSWFRQPDMLLPTTYRYMITSGVGISILLATLISLGNNLNRRLVLFSLALILIVIQIFSTRTYINELLDLHSQETTNKIWSQIPTIPELGRTKDPIIFYFDGAPRGILHDVLIFGFPAKIALLQDPSIRDYNSITMDIWEELVYAVKDGTSLKRFGLPLKPIPINNVYSFNLVSKDVLLNTTEETRKNIIKALQEATPSAQ